MNRKYGWIKDTADHRDLLFKEVHPYKDATPLPAQVSLRSQFKFAPWDQGHLGSCSAHAVLACYTYERGDGPWSRLELYYQERAIEGRTEEDSGAMLRDGIKVLNSIGVGLEKDWPYDTSKFTHEPPAKEMQEAAENKITVYSSLQSANDYRSCLAANYPFMIGIQIFESFESDDVARTGIVPMPHEDENCLGGHAVTVIGYDINFRSSGKTYYELRNSWGTEWGDHGHFWMPAEYIENPDLSTDAWTIRR